MPEETYNGFLKTELESAFLDTRKVFDYGNTISPMSLNGEPFKRVGGHIVFAPVDIFTDACKSGRYKQEIKKDYQKIYSLQKSIRGEIYVTLIDNKTDQTREVLDYIISGKHKTKLYVISPDNMFWFFHDIGHGYLSDICDNFYENVYGFPEMLVNIFACMKQKQYRLYSRKIIDREIGEKCVRYREEDKKYFFNLLDSLHLEDDI